MTYSELLHSVDFDDIAPYVAKYHGDDDCMVMYRIHYDILRGMTPHREEDDNGIVTISYYEPSYEGEEVVPGRLDAYPLEGDLWEVSLAKELVIAPDVTAPLAEVAACCLWHSSFYGFTPRQREEFFRNLENDECEPATD